MKEPDGIQLQNAFHLLQSRVKRTPILTSTYFDSLFNAKVFFKCENFQKTGAFKFRGASFALESLEKKQSAKGVCTHSSGNHAQALALSAKLRNIPAHIVMPNTAPAAKVAAVKEYGGIVTFCEPTLQAREETLFQIQKETDAVFVHPYNDPRVIMGQSSCFQESLQQLGFKPDILITPLGGGGLLSGSLLAAKHFSPKTKVLGAEPLEANDGQKSLQNDTFIPSQNPITIADGLKTSMGSNTWPIIQKYADDILSAEEKTISEYMFRVWERMKIIIEPSSAVPLACMAGNTSMFESKTVLIILSGGNVDFSSILSLKEQP